MEEILMRKSPGSSCDFFYGAFQLEALMIVATDIYTSDDYFFESIVHHPAGYFPVPPSGGG